MWVGTIQSITQIQLENVSNHVKKENVSNLILRFQTKYN